jgi:deazaflavin-dependent oxidoreductase (nitroreductase family)
LAHGDPIAKEASVRALKAELRANGRVSSGPMAGRRLMILTTTGAKSGEPRETVVTFSRDGDRYVIAASQSGAPANPAWFHNLVAHPEVVVEVEMERFNARATVTSGAERDRLWEQHVSERSVMRDYQAKTTRVIPVIALDRIAARGDAGGHSSGRRSGLTR